MGIKKQEKQMKNLNCRYIACDDYMHMNRCALKQELRFQKTKCLDNDIDEATDEVANGIDTYCDHCEGCGFNSEKFNGANYDDFDKEIENYPFTEEYIKKAMLDAKERMIKILSESIEKYQKRLEIVKSYK